MTPTTPKTPTTPTTGAPLSPADQLVVDRDTVLGPLLPLVLSADSLGEAVGVEVRIDRLRYKPARSAVAAWTAKEPTPFGRHGLVVVHSRREKVAKAWEAARRTGSVALGLSGTEDHVVITGALGDRALSRSVERLLRDRPAVLRDARLVRHNPMRRQVWAVRDVDGGAAVLRIGVDRVARRHETLLALVEAGVPLVAPTSAPTARSELLPWWGETDLASMRHGNDARGPAAEAGRALHLLHRTATPETVLPAPPPDLEHVVGSADVLVPATTERVADLVQRAGARLHGTADDASVVLHGDFSADQVLVDRAGAVRLVDLDRLAPGPVERDLGSFAAATRLDGGPDLVPPLLHGYAAAGGRWDDGALAAWTAHGLLVRLTEPFRRRDPDWRTRWDEVLDVVEQVIA